MFKMFYIFYVCNTYFKYSIQKIFFKFIYEFYKYLIRGERVQKWFPYSSPFLAMHITIIHTCNNINGSVTRQYAMYGPT